VTADHTHPALVRFATEDYRRTVGAVALVVGNRDVAEDAVQEALARAMQRRHREDALREPTAWITVVALNVARRRFRRAATERRAVERLPVAEPTADATDALALRTAMAALPRRQREVVVLHYFCGWPVAEVARHLGVHDGTVKTSLSRARAALARALDEPTDHSEETDDARSR
jgi:RNA polymerase sigma-70 factor (ECF subfamily)